MNTRPQQANALSPAKRIISLLLKALGRWLNILRRLSNKSLSFLANLVNFIRVRYFEFVPRPDDIFIVTYPRSGTTWMQMILYQLTTDGNMDFPHVSQVSPWFERAASRGVNLETYPSPRVFKSHLRYKWIPKGKYVYVARNGKDVAVSYFQFYSSHLGFRQTFDKFFDRFLQGKVEFGSWFKHVVEWSAHREDPDVLYLRYEDMLCDFDSCLQKIIDFCRLTIPPKQLPEIRERCGFAFMKEHESKFDHATLNLWENGISMNSFLRKGQAGNWKELLSGEQEARFEREFEKHLGRPGIDRREKKALLQKDVL